MKKLSLLFFFIMNSHASAYANDLKLCPHKPSCASSKAGDKHAIAPFQLKKSEPFNHQRFIVALTQLDGSMSITQDENYIHAGVSSRVFRFVDDLDLIIGIEQQLIHVRSASRTGYYNFGVNRRRVEKHRSLLKQHGIIL